MLAEVMVEVSEVAPPSPEVDDDVTAPAPSLDDRPDVTLAPAMMAAIRALGDKAEL